MFQNIIMNLRLSPMKKQRNIINEFVLPTILIVFAFVLRLLPHPPNFAPIGALALFGGLYLPRRFSLLIPAGAMLLSDALIGFYTWQIMLAVYGSFALTGIIGLLVRRHKNFFTVAAGTLSGSIFFFLITNGAVWAFGSMYPQTLSGLLESYTMALPFFRNSLAGDIFYVGLLIGGYELVRTLTKSIQVGVKRESKVIARP